MSSSRPLRHTTLPSVSEEPAELLSEFVHRHHEDAASPPLDEAADDDWAHTENSVAYRRLPWWKRPSPWWQLAIIPLATMAMSATIAPRIEIYTLLACFVHKPDIFERTLGIGGYPGFPTETSPRLVLPPVFTTYGDVINHVFSSSTSVLGLLDRTDATAQPNLCASDPVVQAAVAKLTVVMAATTGILSCFTAGWWGSFSDRHGRTRVMGISVWGLLLNDFNFIFVTLFFRRLPGGYWSLLLGPIVEGCVGGAAAASAAMHAYLADTTTESTRSRTFSLSMGLLFIGIAFGPTLGGLIVRFTGHPLSVFYAAGLVHFVYACMVWFIIPESLSLRQMKLLRHKYTEVVEGERVRGIVGRLFALLSPVKILMPEIRSQEQGGSGPWKRKGSDWNLTLVAAAYGCTIMLLGAYSYTLQYAASTFGWTSEMLGYFLSLVGAVRAVFLTLILPLAIKMFKPKPVVAQAPTSPDPNPLLSSSPDTASETQPLLDPSATPSPSSTFPDTKPHKELDLDSPRFDLALARVSLFVDVGSYALLLLVPTAVAFTLGNMLSSMGAGFSPAVQSLALGLYKRRGGTESGKLFGALSVVQALCSQILGPATYGLIYMETVATFPRMIYVVSLVVVVVSFILLAFVRLPTERPSDPIGSRDRDVEEDAALEVVAGGLEQEFTPLDVGVLRNREGAAPVNSSGR